MPLTKAQAQEKKLAQVEHEKPSPHEKGSQYVITKTSYIGRLIHCFKFVQYKIHGNEIIKCEDKHLCHDDCNDTIKNKYENIEPLFINDYFSDKFWASPELDIERYKEDIFKLMRLSNRSVFFESNEENSFMYIKFLESLNYCRGLHCINDVKTYFEGNNFFAIIYDIDTESG